MRTQLFSILSAILIFALSPSLKAADSPSLPVFFVNEDPPVEKKLEPEIFDFIAKTLGSRLMDPSMKCEIEARSSRDLRKFSDGERWVDVIELIYRPRGIYSDEKIRIKIPMEARYGVKKDVTTRSGVAETFKIEIGDYYNHWIAFSHDGRNRLVRFEMGNSLRTLPCWVRD